MFEKHDIGFWIAVIGATAVKLATSSFQSFIKALTSGFAAIFSSWVFTDPLLHWLNLSPDTYTAPVAALLALTGEGIMRTVMNMADDPGKAVELWKLWRGGK